ncbi:DNA repair protein XRCC2 homolog isoform X2 [Selaginella moellendorffii]|uniref:DNA repair protein XRCC2 homolog isoform X2 n=1 Tax=Selaginella moellendorffii TaxID=88036 RepID=UPI000D1C38D1|nr:DNA repair protein XRCC2 homolog isoform X2 [Selaginella moellendorffii]|eukprot:XP_024527405.1 DNA repair protein XRCC2 homolog isoform X2 [Selaginella moellendorffii]
MPRRKKSEGWIRKRRAPVAPRWRRRSQAGDSSSSRKKELDMESVTVTPDQVRGWCATDETAVDAFQGWASKRSESRRECGIGRAGDLRRPPVVSIAPPLDRAALRPGHVLEIAGPSGSGKTELLIQAAVSCVLPASFNGVSYGGSEAVVLMFDLDGRFDIARLTSVLKARINEAHKDDTASNSICLEEQGEEVLRASLRRFYCLRCFKSFEFLASLKSLHIQSSRISQEHHGKAVQLVLIDGIGSFYWLDWMSSCAAAYTSRRTLGVQRFSELIVQELRNLRNTKLFLVLATKALLYAPPKRKAIASRIQYREYMPAAWQRFVTHRLFLQPPPQAASGARVFTAQWDKPSLVEKDEFFIHNHGVQVVTKIVDEHL